VRFFGEREMVAAQSMGAESLSSSSGGVFWLMKREKQNTAGRE
jgi:hypothetical protein